MENPILLVLVDDYMYALVLDNATSGAIRQWVALTVARYTNENKLKEELLYSSSLIIKSIN